MEISSQRAKQEHHWLTVYINSKQILRCQTIERFTRIIITFFLHNLLLSTCNISKNGFTLEHPQKEWLDRFLQFLSSPVYPLQTIILITKIIAFCVKH